MFIKLQDESLINMKIFKNGKIQMTGLKDIDNGTKAINILIDYIKEIYPKNNDIVTTHTVTIIVFLAARQNSPSIQELIYASNVNFPPVSISVLNPEIA